VEAVVDYAIYLLDPHGRISSWNSGASRIKGYTAAEVIGRPFSIFFTAKDRGLGKPDIALEAARHDGKFESEGWRLRKDGSQFWANVVIRAVYGDGGALVGFAKVTRDMTEYRAAQQALLESEQRFRLLVQGVTDYAIFMLDPEGRVVNWNAGARRIKGYVAEEIVGQHFSRFYTEEDRAAEIPHRLLDRAKATGRSEAEGWRLRKDGSRFWASVVIDAIFDDDDGLLGFAKVTRDITDRREAQRSLDEWREQMAQAQKLEALGQLTGGIAHNFNNLLQIILSGVRIGQGLADDNQRLKRLLASMGEAASQRVGLTRHLLAFSRKLPTQPETINTIECLQGAVNLLRPSLRSNIRVDPNFDSDLWPVRVDVPQFELALLNVALNARDAMPGDGLLAFTARNETLHEAAPGLWGRFVAVRLRDSGTGIPKEVLGRVLEPFFTTKPVGEGTGLGLSQAYGFADHAGGTLRIESEPGRGTEVTFLLPAASAGAVAETNNPGRAPEPEVRVCDTTMRVLVVDDDAAVGRLASEMLESAGYAAERVTEPNAAMERLESGMRFDLVLCDVPMTAGSNSLDLPHEIASRWPDLPVLLTTTLAAGAGGNGFPVLRKPYSTLELVRAARVLVQRGSAWDAAGSHTGW
jgi:PAS domain S-box-containing protein